MSQFAILCSGQGAQTPELFSSFPFGEKGLSVKHRILEAGCLPPEAAAWLENPAANPQAIFQNHLSQPLLGLYQLMVWAELEPLLPRPNLFAGYSLGELSAYGCTGAFTAEDTVRLAATRARLMDAAGPCGELLAVTGLAPTRAAEQGGHLAIVIGDDHCVMGCPADEAEALAQKLRLAGARDVVFLAVTVASHTPLLDAAVEPFRQALSAVEWRPLRSPLLAGINAAKVLRREQMEQWLPEQIHQTIRWDLVQQRLTEASCRVVLELGPGNQLARMATARRSEARGVGEFRSAEGVATWVGNALRRSS